MRLQVQRGAKRERLELSMTGEKLQQAERPSLELRDDQIAVRHIKTFLIQGTGAIIHQLIKTALDNNVRGLVINLRGTSGGSALESLAAIGAFIEQPQTLRIVPRYDADANRIELGYATAQAFVRVNGTAAENLEIKNPVLFKGPLAVLVDGGCASACEFLPIYIQKNNRGKVYGTPTVGVGNTNTQLFPLLNGGAVNFPTVQIHWADGSGRLPARSQPDTLTPNFLFEHFSSGLDVPLERAITELNGK
ncbi:MAG: hypothetical protein HC933_21370 [Pleurocapsa sp. SU_196_0]|nr:hypothetical protein [Pleurocapsa sp. SU_196_0]